MKTFSTSYLASRLTRYLYVLVSILVLSSCKKDEEPVLLYPSIYHTKEIFVTSDVRLFTKQGEVKDQAIITDFTNRFHEPWDFIKPKSGVIASSDRDTVKILAKDNAKIGRYAGNFHVEFHDNMIYFVPQDTARFEVDYMYELMLAIQKYKPLYENRFPISTSSGYKTIAQSVVGSYAKYTSSQLTFPMLSFLLTQRGGYSYYSIRYNNSFDPTGYKALNTGDTLVVQESELRYEK
ncbi:hypothetical protein QNI19_24865 [Cytophagaceae bacterium DM2B3-1]|uniref:Uncharacterized protein n=1 Tax=Xanthocytophaga flava TaxID=3048013 RepID=A0ABT7CR35_9BACT|nr:hypothetical protein [Xanthocytophaga flavus]MDJ1496193.1 hypothetical protein [Xanthocytophaga flavus]